MHISDNIIYLEINYSGRNLSEQEGGQTYLPEQMKHEPANVSVCFFLEGRWVGTFAEEDCELQSKT